MIRTFSWAIDLDYIKIVIVFSNKNIDAPHMALCCMYFYHLTFFIALGWRIFFNRASNRSHNWVDNDNKIFYFVVNTIEYNKLFLQPIIIICMVQFFGTLIKAIFLV